MGSIDWGISGSGYVQNRHSLKVFPHVIYDSALML